MNIAQIGDGTKAKGAVLYAFIRNGCFLSDKP